MLCNNAKGKKKKEKPPRINQVSWAALLSCQGVPRYSIPCQECSYRAEQTYYWISTKCILPSRSSSLDHACSCVLGLNSTVANLAVPKLWPKMDPDREITPILTWWYWLPYTTVPQLFTTVLLLSRASMVGYIHSEQSVSLIHAYLNLTAYQTPQNSKTRWQTCPFVSRSCFSSPLQFRHFDLLTWPASSKAVVLRVVVAGVVLSLNLVYQNLATQ